MNYKKIDKIYSVTVFLLCQIFFFSANGQNFPNSSIYEDNRVLDLIESDPSMNPSMYDDRTQYEYMEEEASTEEMEAYISEQQTEEAVNNNIEEIPELIPGTQEEAQENIEDQRDVLISDDVQTPVISEENSGNMSATDDIQKTENLIAKEFLRMHLHNFLFANEAIALIGDRANLRLGNIIEETPLPTEEEPVEEDLNDLAGMNDEQMPLNALDVLESGITASEAGENIDDILSENNNETIYYDEDTQNISEENLNIATEQDPITANGENLISPAQEDKSEPVNNEIHQKVEILDEIKKKPAINPADKAYIDLLNAKKSQNSVRLSPSTQKTLDESALNLSDNGHLQDDETIFFDYSKEGNLNSADFNLELSDKNKKFRSPKDNSETLSMAYKALISGQLSSAVTLYKTILDTDSENIDAMFGLATSYHKNYQTDEAKKLYKRLLELQPHHKEALNNFLVLAGKEAPDDALLELQKLERINPDFSPVPAQIAMLYIKMNKPVQAEYSMKRAVMLDPTNISYLYNLAIISDNVGKVPQAIKLYEKLLEASKKGANLPGPVSQIESRLKYLKKQFSLSNKN